MPHKPAPLFVIDTTIDHRLSIRVEDKVVLTPLDLAFLPGEFHGLHVLISGKAPMWFYAHTAARAVADDAEVVSIRQEPSLEIRVFSRSNAGHSIPPPPWLSILPKDDRSATLKISTTPHRRETATGLDLGLFSLPPDTDSLILAGNGANWMYGHLGAVAAARGIGTVFYDSPRESAWVGVGFANAGELRPRPRHKDHPGLVLGILGDPNSGKSVFAKLLASLVARSFPESWTYDCDHASPTPNWFVEAARQGRKAEVLPVRERQKRDWTPEMEAHIARELSNLRSNIELTIADLPGGNHRTQPPQRVPPGREVILREVDAFILLGRTGEPHIIQAWREELRAHHLEDRVIAEVDSCSPDKPFSLQLWQEGRLLKGTASGLDRSQDLLSASPGHNPDENLLVRFCRAWRAARPAR